MSATKSGSSSSNTGKRKSASSSSNSDSQLTLNPTLELTKCIKALVSAHEADQKKVVILDDLIKNILSNLELHIGSKKRELAELDQEYTHRLKNRRIKIEQDIQEFGYTKAMEILTARHEVAIGSDDLLGLRQQIKDLKDGKEAEIKELAKNERIRYDSLLSNLESKLKLQHMADTAKSTAEIENFGKQIHLLHKTNESLQKEIEAQRRLTQSVAEASRPAAHYSNHNPNGGGGNGGSR